MKKQLLIVITLCSMVPAMVITKEPNKKEQKAPFDFDEVAFNWTRTFAEVVENTSKKHYKVSDLEECMIKAIDGFLSALDPHSNFLDPKTYKQILETTSGEFFGIGIVIDNTRQPKDKTLTIIDTIPDGPSDKAGVQPHDKIMEINGEQLEGMSTEEATAKLKGERNTQVHIKVLREGHTDMLSFDITRDVVKEQNSLAFYINEHNISYISLNMFTSTAIKQITQLLQQSKKKKYKALILDLRNNSGGSLSAAIDIAGLFLDKGSLVVTTKDKTHKETERYETSNNPIANDALPIFILMNNYTASAAEILAGVLKIHSEKLSKEAGNNHQKKLMVFLVGTRTFGKGSVQEVIPVSNNCAMKITTSLYFLPNDTSVQGLGIEPDFVIDRRMPPTEQMTWFTKFYGRECALPGYIKVDANKEAEDKDKEAEEEKKKDKEKKTWADRARTMLETDNQLRDTISLINLLYTGKTTCPHNVTTRTKAIEFLKSNFITNDKLTLEEIKI
ncbi:MAG: S41 family peptidase [Candidatus Dependentiae bacterium]|nr:S41 family peptidase [Candidatus Dependentiae bacterium]